ncbi:MAG: indole-3-glycerol phosphate synthase [Nitrospirae bacterium CG_4_9_14_3_um_filter_53_35]|nr:MAG: hypothetical protein AUK29_04815 [Nitrospirae bacterium CG2_30_53_67]PIS37217.1 MAG: indole-3-glycerol phosphate synthase [Nitrospirae bacterium CG08_land_8_20_14_0_20_52_24]PIV83013.1 MAG: indole-3-glycerol phosphate synthase [Nitrospirae bacterium CG17_big_fil_post_rev_8_21_14_2_50_50_9]PIW84501.1 MAG: indole-3-glycerol phosphate synthase [Nitrospirae bacterium CG_4_8_14_3_um_filter_50_41]PIX86609.1 MAG: indole-3-glycerol phosphate synthase [Nitrospirae bacterium CG_4_10_14_3_um_filte
MTLDDILKQVKRRLQERKSRVSMQDLEDRLSECGPTRHFAERISRQGDERIRVIAEVKKASPSKGVLRRDFDPVEIAREYERYGASAISVLTEEDFFLGHPGYLQAVRREVGLPLLRKDFILEPYQVVEARVLGADAFLLIAFLLADGLMQELILLGRDLGMTALVEVGSEEELDRAFSMPAEVIGINNRDLKTFVTDVGNTLNLVGKIPEGMTVVSESGIESPRDLEKLEGAGVDAVLIGEALMRSVHPGEKLRELLGYGKRP